MIPYAELPTVNAALNGTSALLLLAGYSRIRRRDRTGHRAFMIAALVTSILFLLSYLTFHAHAGSVRYQRQGWSRTLYLSILASHSLLAAVIVPMVIITLHRALKGKFDRHRQVARWTFPIWLYVSVTGVIVYLMLFCL